MRHRNAFEGAATREDGRWIVGRTSSYRLEGMVVNVYAPNTITEHRVFLRELQGYLGTVHEPDFLLILGGDWNFFEDPERDRLVSATADSTTTSIMSEICAQHDLVEMWRHVHPGMAGYTWTANRNGHHSAARLDRFLSVPCAAPETPELRGDGFPTIGPLCTQFDLEVPFGSG